MLHKKGSKIINALLVASLCGTTLPSAVFAASNDLTSTNQVPNVTQKTDTSDQVVVVYKKAKSDNIKDTSLKRSDVSQATTVSKQVDVVTPAKGESTDTLKDKLKKDNNVASVCQNVKVKLSSLPNDVSGNASGSESEDAYKLVQADQTWNQVPNGSKKIKVAVIDGGISTTSDDLKNRVETPISEISSGEKAGSPDHGTEVASIIAAEADNNKGIAGFSGKYDVSIVPYVCAGSSDSDGEYIDMDAILASLSDIATKKEASVINMSFALQKDAYHESGETAEESKTADANYNEAKAALQTAINKCADNGTVAVAAAGNSGDNKAGEEVLPADLDNVISVGATDSTGATASFNFNNNADIFAPGQNLSVINSSGKAVTESGTSFSSPIVAANVAELMSSKLPNGKYASASEASNAVTKTSIEKVKDKRLASFATSHAYLESQNPKETTIKTNKITFSYDKSEIEKLAKSNIEPGQTFKCSVSPVSSEKTVGDKLGSLPTITVDSPDGYAITGDWVDANGNKISSDTIVPDAESTTYTLTNIKINVAKAPTATVKYDAVKKAAEEAGISTENLKYKVNDRTYSSDATITIDLKDGKIAEVPTFEIISPKNLDVTSTWKDENGNVMEEGKAPSFTGYTLSDIEILELADDPGSINNIKFVVPDASVKKALTDAGITGVELKYSVSIPEMQLNYGYPIGTLPTVKVTSPTGYTMTGTWVDKDGNPIDEYTMAPQEVSTTYTLSNIKITKPSDSGSTKDNYKTYYEVDTSKVKVPDGITITASPSSVGGDQSPEKANVKIVVTPDNYSVDGEWEHAAGGGIKNTSGGTDGSSTYTYVVKKISKKEDPNTTDPTKKKVKITFKQENNDLPKGLSFTNTTQEWTPGENFDISKFPKISGKATDNIQIKSWFLDQDGKQVTNKTVVPDKDSTYTLYIGITTLPTATFSIDTSGVSLPSGVNIKLSKNSETVKYPGTASELIFPTIDVTPNNEYTVKGKWIRKADGAEIDPDSNTVLINGDGQVDLVYKVTSIAKKDDSTNHYITLKCNANDIYKAAGNLIPSNEKLEYKIDGKTYSGNVVIQLAVKDGKIDHVPLIEIVSPKGLTLQGVWKDASGNVLTKDTKYSDSYTLSDISVNSESNTQPNGNQDNKQLDNNGKNDESNGSRSTGSRSTNGSNSSNGSDNESPKTGVTLHTMSTLGFVAIIVATAGLILTLKKKEN